MLMLYMYVCCFIVRQQSYLNDEPFTDETRLFYIRNQSVQSVNTFHLGYTKPICYNVKVALFLRYVHNTTHNVSTV